MGKRKPPVPRRRIGVHFVDYPVRRPHRLYAEAFAAAEASSTASMDGEGHSGDEQEEEVEEEQSLLPSATIGRDPTVTTPQAPHQTPTDSSRYTSRAHQPPGQWAAPGKSIVSTVGLREQQHSNKKTQQPQQGDAREDEEDTVTMTMAELDAWKKRTAMEIEDHFTNEQLKRIAEFGRVHANLVKEAKEYVFGIETQLKEQFERERESLKSQAEVYVAQFQQENERLRMHVAAVEQELEELKARHYQQQQQHHHQMTMTTTNDDDGAIAVSVDVALHEDTASGSTNNTTSHASSSTMASLNDDDISISESSSSSSLSYPPDQEGRNVKVLPTDHAVEDTAELMSGMDMELGASTPETTTTAATCTGHNHDTLA